MSLPLFSSPDATAPIATLDRMATRHIAWLVVGGHPERAFVQVTGRASVSLSGYADILPRDLFAKTRAWIAEPHAYIEAGAPVQLRRADGATAVVALQGLFEEGQEPTASMACRDLADGPTQQDMREAETGGGYGITSGEVIGKVATKTLTLYATPPSKPLTTLRLALPLHYVYVLESRRGFDRISFHYPGIAVDAWVPQGVVTETNSLTLDPPWSSMRRRPPKVLPSPLLSKHYARARRNVAVEIHNANGTTGATLQRGAVVAIIERARGRVGVKLADRRLDALLWVSDDDLTPCSPSEGPR